MLWHQKGAFPFPESQNCNLPEESLKKILYFVHSWKATVVSGYRTGSVHLRMGVRSLPAHTLSFFHRVNFRKVLEMSSGMEECKIPAWARDKMFSSPDH
jgi:hypothetical protein